jgi:hypothetical protein
MFSESAKRVAREPTTTSDLILLYLLGNVRPSASSCRLKKA